MEKTIPTQARANQPAEKSFSVAAPSVSLPKGGGAIKGIGEKFTANPVTGTGSLSVPIFTSPGRSGFGPQLSLTYDSGAGNGPFGIGWHLPFFAITRRTDKGLLLAPLATLAAEVGAAIVCVTHLNKGSQSSALYRAMGSLAFVAAARAAFAVIRDKDDPARRLILPMKNNLAADTTGVAYSVVAPHGTPLVAWEAEPVIITADEALAPERRDGDGQDRDRPERDDAIRWLRDLLTDGPRSAKEVQNEARAANISLRTLRRAKVELPIETYKEGFGPTGTWVWRLEGVHVSPSNVSTGHLNGNPHATDLPAKAATGHLRVHAKITALC